MNSTSPFGDLKGFIGHEGRAFLHVESARMPECIDFIQSHPEAGVAVCKNLGYYKEDDLEFLRQISHVCHVHVQDPIKDISGLLACADLKYLALADVKGRLDLADLVNLEHLRLDWGPGYENLESCRSLRTLAIWKLKSKSHDLALLKGLPQLETLEITQSDLVSLAGIARLNKLKELKLAYLPKLVEIDAIAQVASSLRLCEFDRVPNIASYGALEKLRELKCLVLNPGGVVPSLDFLTGLSNLEMFSFVRTTIGSGDLSPILGLKKLKQLGFFDRRGYSHREKELKEVFGIE